MNHQAFKLLLENLSDIKAEIADLRKEVSNQNEKYHKLRNRVIGLSVILPFLVSGTLKKIDTPPKAIQEAAKEFIKKEQDSE